MLDLVEEAFDEVALATERKVTRPRSRARRATRPARRSRRGSSSSGRRATGPSDLIRGWLGSRRLFLGTGALLMGPYDGCVDHPAGGGRRVVPSATGAVVLLPFPFSDLSQSRLRPAVVLANAGRSDWVLCQITSNAYGDPLAVPIDQPDFATGSLRILSFARPGKLFMANDALFTTEVGVPDPPAPGRVVGTIVELLQP